MNETETAVATLPEPKTSRKTMLAPNFKPAYKDPYNCVVGGLPNRINMALEASPKTAVQLAVEVGLTADETGVERIKQHFSDWDKKKSGISGHYELTEEGYALKA